MTCANNLYKSHQLNCTKSEECNSRIQQLEYEVTGKEDECMYWYRQVEDAKEEQSKGFAKTQKRRHNNLKKEVKRHE